MPRPKLRAENIRYLALEGGAGKGYAYPPAIEYLERLGILRYQRLADGRSARLDPAGQIRGVAGASAGAIIALGISCGMSSEDIRAFMYSGVAMSFFDPLLPDLVPRCGHSTYEEETTGASRFADVHSDMMAFAQGLLDTARSGVDRLIRGIDDVSQDLTTWNRIQLNPRYGPSTREVVDTTQRIFEGLLGMVEYLLSRILTPTLQLARLGARYYINGYVARLLQRFGFFHGQAARQTFDFILKTQLERIVAIDPGLRDRLRASDPILRGRSDPDLFVNVTFKTHFLAFGTRLAVAATNFEKGVSEIFSAESTPDMCVADAVRMSMGLPVIFMPVHISESEARAITARPLSGIAPERVLPVESLTGLWVDGGYFDNLPVAIFDLVNEGPPSTLGLLLQDAASGPIATFPEFLLRWAYYGVFGTGGSHISASWQTTDQVISLPTDGLIWYDFAPPRADVVSRLNRDVTQAMRHYFSS